MQNWNSPTGQPGDHESWSNPRDSGRAVTVVWLMGMLFVGALLGVGAFALLTMNPSLIGEPPPTPRRPAVAAATPTASPLVPAPTPTSAPTSTPSSVPSPSPASPPSPLPEPALRFARLIEDPDLSYHLETDASVQAGLASLTITMTIDQSGANFAIDLLMAMIGDESDIQVVVKNGTAYVREDRGRWFATDDVSALDLPAGTLAFSQLQADRVEYIAAETRDGEALHHLRIPTMAAAGFDPTELQRAGCDTDNLAMDLWIRDDGTPVTGTFDFSCTAKSGSVSGVLTASATYEFSKVGQPIKIKPPKKFRRL